MAVAAAPEGEAAPKAAAAAGKEEAANNQATNPPPNKKKKTDNDDSNDDSKGKANFKGGGGSGGSGGGGGGGGGVGGGCGSDVNSSESVAPTIVCVSPLRSRSYFETSHLVRPAVVVGDRERLRVRLHERGGHVDCRPPACLLRSAVCLRVCVRVCTCL